MRRLLHLMGAVPSLEAAYIKLCHLVAKIL